MSGLWIWHISPFVSSDRGSTGRVCVCVCVCDIDSSLHFLKPASSASHHSLCLESPHLCLSSPLSPLHTTRLQAGTRRLSRWMPRKRTTVTPAARTPWTLTPRTTLWRSWWAWAWRGLHSVNWSCRPLSSHWPPLVTLWPLRLQGSIRWWRTARRRDLRSCPSKAETWSS